jgi:hypothetical protein
MVYKQSTLDGQLPREVGGFSRSQSGLYRFQSKCIHHNVIARSNLMRVREAFGHKLPVTKDYLQTRYYCLDCGLLVPKSVYNQRTDRQ